MLVSPSAPTTAFKIGEKVDDPLAMYLNDVTTIPANLAGIPGMGLPAGLAEDGLPVGIQLMAPARADAAAALDRCCARGAAAQAAGARGADSLVVGEDLLDRLAEQPRDAERDRQAGIELAVLDRVDRLAREAQLLGEIALRPAALCSQRGSVFFTGTAGCRSRWRACR